MNEPTPTLLIYDGNCSFCTRIANGLQKKSIKPIKLISYHDLSDGALQTFHPELTTERCQGEVQIIQNGKRYPGFFGLRVLVWNLRNYRYFGWILYLPLVPIFGMFSFMILKRFRSKLDPV